MRKLGTAQILALISVAVVMRLLYVSRRIDGGSAGISAGSFSDMMPRSRRSGAWDSRNCVVIGLGVGYPVHHFEMFVGSLRATGYPGHIIIGIGENPPRGVVEYLTKRNVIIKTVTFTKCTFTNYTTNTGQLSSFNQKQKCATGYPDYKIQWGRFPLAADWIRDCPQCTEGVMLSDVRDAYFQRDPFAAVTTPHPIMVFEEHPMLTTEYWLVGYIVKQCKGQDLGKRPMLCSGSTMGTRDGILAYIDEMVKEFDAWLAVEKCRFDIIGDDQSIHDYLFYEGRLPGAVMIPYRTGPIHIVGGPADKIFRAAIKEAEKDGHDEGWVNSHRFYGTEENWEQWLDPKHNLTDEHGYITNLDGTPSPQVHQFDRFGRPFLRWLERKVKDWNKQLDAQ
eukprot:m.177193 g.177193  ORF g.177193 m.177193 type:complete len:392 (+) comp14305_c0_seq1:473-1648(+)